MEKGKSNRSPSGVQRGGARRSARIHPLRKLEFETGNRFLHSTPTYGARCQERLHDMGLSWSSAHSEVPGGPSRSDSSERCAVTASIFPALGGLFRCEASTFRKNACAAACLDLGRRVKAMVRALPSARDG